MLAEHINDLKHNIDFLNPTILHVENNLFKRRFSEECLISWHNEAAIIIQIDSYLLCNVYKIILDHFSKRHQNLIKRFFITL